MNPTDRPFLGGSTANNAFFCTAAPDPLNIRLARARGDWLRYNLIMHVFMSLVSSMLQQCRRSRFDMPSHSIRSSTTLTLGTGKQKD